ncbi:CONDITIONAL LOSS-OF-GROWTH 1 [Salix koriyanagi]|uniref:CONDITIONAL LOSS-OF-GROWTH 1 n=1 Tax=Salix koriyanagi TaxID=2511006 RepID=A0A9Q0WKD5_9ROSI|nr:CONDITIONAL LOSS-OF-GROWTH 1 [Salix koriyanagi]
MSSTFSSSRNSPGSSRLQLQIGAVSRLRSSSLKKPPEPLRRAVADCLSSSATVATSHHAISPVTSTDASRTLVDYLAAPTTTDLAYGVILEHTIAERERSPAVVGRCVTHLKRYLLRYRPSEETLFQIDRFCLSIIAECDISLKRTSSTWSGSLNQQSVSSTAPANYSPSPPVYIYASEDLVKSLNYMRSLVARHIPKRSFQPAAFTGVPSVSRQSLPTQSSLLSRSFNSQLSPSSGAENSEKNGPTTLPVSNLSNVQNVEVAEDLDYIADDVLKWRWAGQPFLSTESDRPVDLHDVSVCKFLELGAAALLVGDMEDKMKGQPRKYFGTADMPYHDQLLQPLSATTITNSASARRHLRTITSSKRSKAGPHQIWEDTPVSMFRPRARQLFQYRHYSEQQPLRLNPAEVCEVIAAVSSETYSDCANHLTVSSRLSNNSGKPSVDVAVSVLIKLVIDMYVLDSGTAAPLTLSMLEEMLNSSKTASRVRAFDLILNLGVHAHLLEPMLINDASTIEEEYSQESFFDCEEKLPTQGNQKADSVNKLGTSSAINNFESWILNILYEILLLLVQTEEKEESVWASALSCLLYFVCDRGKILRNRLEGLDIRVIKSLIETSRKNSWAELVHSKLICMLTNMFYQVSDGSMVTVTMNPVFLIDQLDLIGGIEFIFHEYSLANLREERRNLYLILFDSVLHQINDACVAAGESEFSDNEIQSIATLLTLANAPEAFYISLKLGLEGIGELLRSSISGALSRYPNNERLNMLLENVTEKFNAIISSFTHLDKEFSHLIETTQSYKFLKSIESAVPRNGVVMKAKLSWATLHSLLHSEKIAYRQNGYTWLGDLLIAEITEGRDMNVCSNVEELQRKIAYAGVHDSSVSSDVPLSIWLMCGLLKSKHNIIRWGFLFVLERLLMRCKFLLDKNEMQHPRSSNASQKHADSRLEKANAVIDIMSSALSLVAQINETDRINILKMCGILLSQLCLKVLAATAIPNGEGVQKSKVCGGVDENKKNDTSDGISQLNDFRWNEFMEEADSRSSYSINSSLMCKTASMAAMLLQGQAIVPMQLVARVPAALFYWPLIQLAGAATDNIALGVAVVSKGRGNLPGAASDIRATLLLLLIGKCTADPSAFQEVGGEEFFRELLDDTDSRVAYYSSAFLLKRMMTEKPDEYKHMLQNLIFKAQQSNNEKLLENPYLQVRGLLQLSNDGL